MGGGRGTYLRCAPADIILLDVYRAVEVVEGTLFSVHDSPDPKCPVGRYM